MKTKPPTVLVLADIPTSLSPSSLQAKLQQDGWHQCGQTIGGSPAYTCDYMPHVPPFSPPAWWLDDLGPYVRMHPYTGPIR